MAAWERKPTLEYEIECIRPENAELPLTPTLAMIRGHCRPVYVREQEGVVALQIPFVHYDRHFDMFIADFPRDINGRRWWTLMVNLQLLDLKLLTEENYSDVLYQVQFPHGNPELALYTLGGGLNVNTEENSLDYDLEILHGEKFFDMEKIFACKSGDKWARQIYLTFLRIWGAAFSHIWLYPDFVCAEDAFPGKVAGGDDPADDEIPF
ncbi:MAG: hypothetical protein LBH01_08705 [Verrucomicrobiales bacterium]|nr:hypothetical protein [Verrucomicrobiales bacterium]